MRTNIVLNDELVNEAFKYAKGVHTKRELVEIALQEFVNNRKMRDIRELRGEIEFAEGYDYKAMRADQ
jgi:Arc/MetJ family transcription regulator